MEWDIGRSLRCIVYGGLRLIGDEPNLATVVDRSF